MTQEIEIEFKNILNKDEFSQLSKAFSLMPEQFKTQTNHYFDTDHFSLKSIGSALRIRFKQKEYVLTLKEPHPDGLLETHQALTEIDAHHILKTGQFPDGPIKEQLKKADILIEALKPLGELTTHRAVIPYYDGEIMLDHSIYLQTEDYECEYEAQERVLGEKTFNQLLVDYMIPLRPTKNKIQRFFDQKLQEESLHE